MSARHGNAVLEAAAFCNSVLGFARSSLQFATVWLTQCDTAYHRLDKQASSIIINVHKSNGRPVQNLAPLPPSTPQGCKHRLALKQHSNVVHYRPSRARA